METHGQQLAETYLEMLNTHEPDLVDRFVAEQYRNHNPFVADGREANRQFWTAFFGALPDLSATMEDLVISGDRVVGRYVYRGTHTGELMGIAASFIARLLQKHHWIAYVGLAVILYVAVEMIYRGALEVWPRLS